MTAMEFIPIYVFLTIVIFSLTYIAISKIRERYVGLNKEPDFLEKLVIQKKRELDGNIGGMSFRVYSVLLVVIPIISTLLIWLVLKKPIAGVIFGVVSISFPEIILRLTRARQKHNFEERYARALKSLASSLESGLSVQQAVKEIINNPFIHENIKRGFKQIDADISVGISVPKAFKRFAEDTKSDDAKDVASAISMQSEVGGSEAKVIETIASNIRDRILMRKEIKTLFTDVTAMITAMDFIPYMMLLILYFFAPQIIAPFFDSVIGIVGFTAIIIYMIIGSLYLHSRLSAAKGGRL